MRATKKYNSPDDTRLECLTYLVTIGPRMTAPPERAEAEAVSSATLDEADKRKKSDDKLKILEVGLRKLQALATRSALYDPRAPLFKREVPTILYDKSITAKWTKIQPLWEEPANESEEESKLVDIVGSATTKMIRGHKRRIESHYGKEIALKDEFISNFNEIMAAHPITLHPLVKSVKKPESKTERSLVVHFSDTHFGCNIDKNELNNLNEFNWTIASRRSAWLIDQAVTYKPQYRDQTELLVLINGDIIAGVIHDQEWAVDLLTTQFSGALSILGQGLTYAARNFKKVRVVCTPGNHGRAMHKTNKDRATVHKWDSYENMLYLALREMLKAYSNVEFTIPECPYAIVDIQGHKFLVTHGDTVINVGNPGKNLNMKSINEQINKVNAQLIPGTENFAGIIVGHVHVCTVQETDSGTMLMINGTLSGLDGFAQSLGIFSVNSTQTLFEVTPKYAVGDIRLIRLRNADTNAKLDGIIKPFSGKF